MHIMEKNLIINWFETIDSTNTQALREIATAPEGSVWIADFQTAGRGQRGNAWESVRGKNLTFTLLIRPEFVLVTNQFDISIVVSLGVCRYLKERGIDARIKWPNDIYTGDKKICGMLIEHTLCGDKLAASIAGIGINLNQTEFASDAPNPVSLLLLTGREKEYDRKEELNRVLSHIYTLYEDLEHGYAEEIKEEYLNNLYRFNEYHRFIEIDPDVPADVPVEKMKGGGEIIARIFGVAESGCLLLEHRTGEIKEYAFKEIKYVI